MHEAIEKKLWEKVDRYRWIFELCPYVRMVAVCNSLANGRVKATSDIDLFIVTEHRHMWTARLFMKIITQLCGMRVHHDKVAGRFCLSFFVSEKSMNLDKVAYAFDPHLADFAKLMQPVYEFSKGTYEKFLVANEKWTLRYFHQPLSDFASGRKSHLKPPFVILTAFKKMKEFVLCIFGNLIEKVCYRIQIKKDRQREKNAGPERSVILEHDIFKFHEKDTRKEIAERFSKEGH